MKLSPVTSASSTCWLGSLQCSPPPTPLSSVWWNCDTDSEISVQNYMRYRGLPSHLVLHPQKTTSQGTVQCQQCLSITSSAGIMKRVYTYVPIVSFVCVCMCSHLTLVSAHQRFSIMVSNDNRAHHHVHIYMYAF